VSKHLAGKAVKRAKGDSKKLLAAAWGKFADREPLVNLLIMLRNEGERGEPDAEGRSIIAHAAGELGRMCAEAMLAKRSEFFATLAEAAEFVASGDDERPQKPQVISLIVGAGMLRAKLGRLPNRVELRELVGRHGVDIDERDTRVWKDAGLSHLPKGKPGPRADRRKKSGRKLPAGKF
jgi:hypothetical protein